MKYKKPKFWDSKQKSFFAILLFPFSLLFLLFSKIKNIKPKTKFSIPVVCIGNIYLGGTGKTPVAMEIFKITQSLGKKPGFVKKFYSYLEDEINMLKEIGATFVYKNRIEAINVLIKNKYDLAVLDDGLQDPTIKKDFSIVCFNSEQWIGNGLLIPAGPLREKLSSINAVDCIIINGNKNKEIEEQIFKYASGTTKIFYSKYKIINSEKFKNKNLIAFAGIGNPINFFNLLNENNFKIYETISFPDHHYFLEKEFNLLLQKAEKINGELITTEKDYNRMSNEQKKYCNFIKVDLEIKDKSELINLIKNKI
tara:strand:+ start:2017 stop:2946 length:930 start_codon:yes stop_codon:yes gene_type:complete